MSRTISLYPCCSHCQHDKPFSMKGQNDVHIVPCPVATCVLGRRIHHTIEREHEEI